MYLIGMLAREEQTTEKAAGYAGILLFFSEREKRGGEEGERISEGQFRGCSVHINVFCQGPGKVI